MSAARVLQLWRELTAALGRIEPKILDNLHPGADDAAIERLRAGLTMPLPAEMEALYRANNGEGRLGLDFETPVALFSVVDPAQASGKNEYYFMEIDGVDGVVTEFDSFLGMAEDRADLDWMEHRGPVRPASTGWIPFAKDFGGNFLCSDMDPDAGGTPGQIIEVAYDDSRLQVVSTGLAEFLADLLRSADKVVE